MSCTKAMVLAVLACATTALAEHDTFSLGSGRNGALVVSVPTTTINAYAQVTAAASAGATSLQVASSTDFAAGDLVMVLQTTGISPEPPSGGAGPIDISNDAVGRWELTRLASVSGTTLELSAPLDFAYAAQVTQVIRVPEYTTVTINLGGRITAKPWDGSTGGVVAFLVQGALQNDGAIDVSGQGFRGGAYVNDFSNGTGCSGLDEPEAQGARKGEGIAASRYGANQTGRGNVANAGGGGVCLRSGGGGGGNGGAGGQGGNSDTATDGNRPVGGMGGASLLYSPLNRLLLGGGGGSGHGTTGLGQAGHPGGGIIFFRAAQITGSGTLTAAGAGGLGSTEDAAGGGGAGGTLYVRSAGNVTCTRMTVEGGAGGTTTSITSAVGPGGGGGGGRVLFQSSGVTCPIDANGGSNGAANDGAHGATPGGNGLVLVLPGGFASPTVPVILEPANGSATNDPRVTIRGTAQEGVTVVVYLDGAELGRVVPDATGVWAINPSSDLTEGVHQVQAAALYQAVWSNRSPTNNFTVDFVAPAKPVVSTPANNSTTNDPTPTVTGTAEANSTVTVYFDGTPAGTTTADASGAWIFVPSVGLADGTHTVSATATDAAGNVSPSSDTNTFTLDATAPAAPVVLTPANGSFTNDSTPTVTGTAEPGIPVTVFIDGPAAGTTTADASGNWAFTPTTPLADGLHNVKAWATDAFGNNSPVSNINNFTVDTVAPIPPVISAPANNSSTSDPTPTVQGTAEAGSTVTVFIDGSVAGTTTADAFGAWTFTPVATLAEGTHDVWATATDAAGNVSAVSNTNRFTVDVTVPETLILQRPPDPTRSTSATFDFDTNQPGAGFECRVDGGTFGSCSDPFTITGLSEGQHTLEVRARDAAGNVDPTPAVATWTVDVTPPAAPVVSTPADGSVTNDTTPEIRGTAEVGTQVTVRIDGTVVGTAAVDASGNWTLTPTQTLAEGSHQVNAVAVDAAGNESPVSNTNTFIVDIAAPDTFIISGPDARTLETDATFDFASSDASATFECSLDGAAFAPCSDPITFRNLAEGDHTLDVRARDASGSVDPTPARHTWSVVVDRAIVGGGFGCSASGGGPALVWMALAALGALGSRRRRR